MSLAAVGGAGLSHARISHDRSRLPPDSGTLVRETVVPPPAAPSLPLGPIVLPPAGSFVLSPARSLGPLPTVTAQPSLSATPPQFVTGQNVRLSDPTGHECVNVREAPSLTGRVLVCLPAGSILQVVEGPNEVDGHRWWRVDTGGWAAGDYLVAADRGSGLTPSFADSIRAAISGSAAGVFSQSPLYQSPLYGYSGWATYYGIEDGFRRGDIMYDGTSYDPADPTITAASFAIPLHTWLRVCTIVRCIAVQVRDRGLLDQNGILLDLSRAAYALLFGGLSGKQWISAFLSGPVAFPLARPPSTSSP